MFQCFQYNKAVEQRRIDPVVRAGLKSLLTLPRMRGRGFVLFYAGAQLLLRFRDFWDSGRRRLRLVSVSQPFTGTATS